MTQSKSEAVAAQHLANQDFEVLNPVYIRRRLHSPRRGGIVGTVHAPRFPGYIFVSFNRRDPQCRWQAINGTRGVKRLMGYTSEEPEALDKVTAQALLDRYGHGPVDDDEVEKEFHIGMVLRITEGVYAGHQGICTWSTAELIKMELKFFGRPTPIALRSDQVIAARI